MVGSGGRGHAITHPSRSQPCNSDPYGGTCYGDSGGPHFNAAGEVVSVTVTGDRWCRSTDKTYRMDTADAQDFLAQFLD